MSILTRLSELVGVPRDAAPVRPVMAGMSLTPSLIPGVSTTTSLGLSAVWRCLDVLSTGVSQLPWRELRSNLELPPSRLVERPYSQWTRRDWTGKVVATMALYDVAYLLKIGGYDSEGVTVSLFPLDPSQVAPVTTNAYSYDPPAQYWIGQTRVDATELVICRRSPRPGIDDSMGGVLRLARVTFAAAMAAEHYASRYWQSGGNPIVALETDAHLNMTEANEVADRWSERRSRGPDYAPVLSGGIKAHPFGADPTAESAVEARREMVADIGRYFGVPTRMVNAPAGDSETYSNVESANLDLIRFTLRNYIAAIEDAISDQLPRGRRMAMDTTELTAGTQLDRAQALRLLLDPTAPVISQDEAREAMGYPPQEMPASMPAPTAPVGGPSNGNP